ncbi:MAG: hypothetical protein IIW32_06040 [Bacteroides sp.]|nr:hypothetical protein [Bacteroides sp.]
MYRQVAQLQRLGQLDEACQLAQTHIQDGNADTNLLRINGMVLADIIKRDSERYFFDAALSTLHLFVQTPLPADEIAVYNHLVDSLSIFITRLTERPGYEQRLNRCFDLITNLPIYTVGFSFILFVKKVLKLKGWNRLGEFAYWCGLIHLRDEDYKPFKTNSGNQIMSLAEQLSIRIAKYLIETKQLDKIADFIPQLQDLYQVHPEYTYPPYFLTQLYLLVDDREQAMATLLPFVRKKSRDFWVWQRMAEVESNLDNKVTYYAKAIHCGSRKEEMLVSLYLDAALIMLQANHLAFAKWLVDKTREIRHRNNWHDTAELSDMIHQAWYHTTTALKDDQWLQEKANEAEIIALGRVQRPTSKQAPRTSKAKQQHFSGKLRIASGGYGFVHDNQLGDIFIPTELLASHHHGERITGLAKEKFDKKKQRMSLAAYKINES